MATALPTLDIHESGIDLARKTVFIKLHLGLLGKARALLEGMSTDALRNMPLVRTRIREGMACLATQMDVLAGDRVNRKFRFDEEGGQNSCANVSTE